MKGKWKLPPIFKIYLQFMFIRKGKICFLQWNLTRMYISTVKRKEMEKKKGKARERKGRRKKKRKNEEARRKEGRERKEEVREQRGEEIKRR